TRSGAKAMWLTSAFPTVTVEWLTVLSRTEIEAGIVHSDCRRAGRLVAHLDVSVVDRPREPRWVCRIAVRLSPTGSAHADQGRDVRGGIVALTVVDDLEPHVEAGVARVARVLDRPSDPGVVADDRRARDGAVDVPR